MPHPNERALIHHMMRQRLLRERPLRDAALRPGAAPRTEASPDEPGDDTVQMTETRIYVGLNDAETRQQTYETGKYLDILKDVCRNYRVAFTVDIEAGGYYHEDGNYTEETSLVLVLIDADREAIQEIANYLCAFFRQESVLVTEDRISGCFISANPSK